MPRTAVVWFRRDLRVHDHPALRRAAENFDRVLPVFAFDPTLLNGRFRSLNRTAFMLETLRALDAQLRQRGSRLVICRDEDELVELIATHADVVLHSTEATGYARDRVERVEQRSGIPFEGLPGVYIADDFDGLLTGKGAPYTVFSPFLRSWLKQPRRAVLDAPAAIPPADGVDPGTLPTLRELGFDEDPPELLERPQPGEDAGLAAAEAWLEAKVAAYDDERNVLARATSRMSAHLRFGAVSARRLEQLVRRRRSSGAETYLQELAWRDFYGYVLHHHPESAYQEFQAKYRKLMWSDDLEAAQAWKDGRTGYPVIDAAMRQVRAQGWMHNRARMVVGSFLTKDLHLDWRVGEQFFMEHLLDGDVPSNNGGWQWVASTGTDPAPFTRRLFNPTLQQQRYDPAGEYVRRWIPELRDVPDKKLAEPWTMTPQEQERAGCLIGRDYPEPIVDHARERRRAIERYNAVRT